MAIKMFLIFFSLFFFTGLLKFAQKGPHKMMRVASHFSYMDKNCLNWKHSFLSDVYLSSNSEKLPYPISKSSDKAICILLSSAPLSLMYVSHLFYQGYFKGVCFDFKLSSSSFKLEARKSIGFSYRTLQGRWIV